MKVLPADYYWTHFLLMVQYAFSRYRSFFTEAEQNQIQQFFQLPKNAQLLFIRLFNRKGEVFRQDKLHYPEIEDLNGAVALLQQQGFFTSLTHYPWIYLSKKDLFQRLMVLFFCNRHQSMTDFVLVDLEKVRYEKYTIDPSNFFFPNRIALETYLELEKKKEELPKNEQKSQKPKKPKNNLNALKTPPQRILSRKKNSEYRGTKSTWFGLTQQPLTVEALVLEAFREEGWKGIYAENPFLLTLCTFLCWEILFSPIPGAFHHPYQAGPMDLFSESFFQARKGLFEKHFEKLSQLSENEILLFFSQRAREKWEITCTLNASAQYQLDHFLPFLQVSGGVRIAQLSRILFQSLNERKRGFPDLVLWKKDPLQLKIVEVKGPRDRLSDAQKVWLDTLMALQYEVEVVLIEEIN